MGFLWLTVLTAAMLLAAGTTAEKDYLDEYFDKVVDNFSQQLDQAGLSSLKINDTTLQVNRSISGIPLLGSVTYKNGILLDVGPLEAQKEGHRGGAEDDGVHLFYQINFPNLTIFSDVEANISPFGSAVGTAELLFLNTSIGVYIDKNYTLATTEVSSKTQATMAPATNYLPVSDVMDAAAALGRLELGYGLLWDHVSMWCEQSFTPMLKKAVQEIEFPMFPPSHLSIVRRH